MAYIAIVEALDGKAVEWMEKVTGTQYGTPLRAEGQAMPARGGEGARPRPAQGAIGDFAPKLVELTDDVLYADVWERTQLSKRDRSQVTVSALIAMNRPDNSALTSRGALNWRDAGGVDRDHHTLGVLRGLA